VVMLIGCVASSTYAYQSVKVSVFEQTDSCTGAIKEIQTFPSGTCQGSNSSSMIASCVDDKVTISEDCVSDSAEAVPVATVDSGNCLGNTMYTCVTSTDDYELKLDISTLSTEAALASGSCMLIDGAASILTCFNSRYGSEQVFTNTDGCTGDSKTSEISLPYVKGPATVTCAEYSPAPTPAPTAVAGAPSGWPASVPETCWPGHTGEQSWECLTGSCATYEWRDSKSALVALLLQIFLGTLGGGYWYYGYYLLAVLQLLLGLLPCLSCCLYGSSTGAGFNEEEGTHLTSTATTTAYTVGSGSGAPGVELTAYPADSLSDEGSGMGMGSGGSRAYDEQPTKDGAGLYGIVSVCIGCASCAGHVWWIVVIILVAMYNIYPQQDATCLVKM